MKKKKKTSALICETVDVTMLAPIDGTTILSRGG